jgi:hypothetical protein
MKCKYFLALGIWILFTSPILAETQPNTPITAVANPQATSTGSVTNQAVQVLQGPYITNSYGGGVSCQGPTFNLTPFVVGTQSGSTPFESYANIDNDVTTGMTIDGVPGLERTGQKNNFSTNYGISATLSFPLDGGLQARCKTAADTWTSRQQAETDKARLDFELVRLLKCGEAMKNGIFFNPASPYAKICADVLVIQQRPSSGVISQPFVPSSKVSKSSYQVPSKKVVESHKASDLGSTIVLPSQKSD